VSTDGAGVAEATALAPQGASGGRLSALVSTRSFGIVLLLLVISYAGSVSLSLHKAASIVIAIQLVTVWFALHVAGARKTVRYTAFVLMAYAAIAGVWGAFIDAEGPWWVYLASGLLYLIAPFAIIRNVAMRPRVDREGIVGAISAYVFIGMAFAFLFRTVALAQSGAFFGTNGDGSMAETLFFSFTTLTTVGYGNLVPAANPGQSFAVIEMVLGPLFLIMALGKIVAAWQPKVDRPGSRAEGPGGPASVG
jgi:ion channel